MSASDKTGLFAAEDLARAVQAQVLSVCPVGREVGNHPINTPGCTCTVLAEEPETNSEPVAEPPTPPVLHEITFRGKPAKFDPKESNAGILALAALDDFRVDAVLRLFNVEITDDETGEVLFS